MAKDPDFTCSLCHQEVDEVTLRADLPSQTGGTVRLCDACNGEYTAPEEFVVGQRVVFKDDTDRYPHFVIPAGTTGTVSLVAGCDAHVKVDGEVPGLTDDDEWAGEFYWNPSNGDEGQAPFTAIKEG